MIDWTREGRDALKQRSLAYICSQLENNTYYTDSSSDGTRVVTTVVHKEEVIIIGLNVSASVLDTEMTGIRIALEDASGTRAKITIHTDSLTAVNMLNNGKLELDTTTGTIRYAESKLTQRPTIKWIPVHTGIPGNRTADNAAKRGLQLYGIDTTVNASSFRIQTTMKEQIRRNYNEQTYNGSSQQTKDYIQIHQTDSSRMKLMSLNTNFLYIDT